MSDGNAPILNTPAWLQCEGKEPFASAMLAADHPLWSRVDRSGGPEACWPWTGPVMANGYGRVMIDGRYQLVSRVVYADAGGTLSSSNRVRFTCDERRCANPTHLFSLSDGLPAEKRCTRCGEMKPVDQFYARSPIELLSDCKPCNIKATGAWGSRNRASINAHWPTRGRVRRQSADIPLKLVQSAKTRAKAKGMEFNITVDDVVIPEFCPVLGIPLKSASGTGAKGSLPNSPSIDRIDNSRGYVRGNIVVVSMRANRIKHNATVEELEAVSTFYRKLADASIGGVFKPW